jgi:serine/threonine-protein kinase
MSQVWCAEHTSLGTKVALKFLLPELANLPDAPQRFVREARAAARVKSEHVARVLDEGMLPEDGTPYMVMEFLEGKDLGRYIREGKRFPVDEALALTVQAADALSRAHAVGVIHRDVKPSNLFLTHRPDGAPFIKVLDFGIAKVVEDADKDKLQLTKTTVVMGSALYMSLEQMRSTRTVDHRTDIYALGVSLYELLTGTHPFTAESFAELCVKVSLDPPEPLRDHRPDVPEALAEAIAVAYARNAPERYQTSGSFATALLPFATPETARHIEAITRFERERYPDGKIPERVQTPPLGLQLPTVRRRRRRIDWSIYGPLGGALLAAVGAVVATRQWPSTRGSSSGGHADTAPPDAALLDAAVATAPAADAAVGAPVSSVPVDAGAGAAEVDAGAPDGGKGKTNTHPCRPGDMVRMPNGLLKPCGM